VYERSWQLVAIALVAAVVAEHAPLDLDVLNHQLSMIRRSVHLDVTRAPARPGALTSSAAVAMRR